LSDALQNLSWQVQLTLAGGYLAYVIAYTGIRSHHTPIDTAFLSFVFGLPVAATLWACQALNKVIFVSLLAVVMGCLIALIWRKYVRSVVRATLHRWDISWSTDDPTTIATLSDNAKFGMTAFAVQLKDETWLECKNPHEFEGAPFNPVIIGKDGSVALYVTHKELKGQPEEAIPSVRDEQFGDKITYIPASEIRQIVIRHRALNS
jgi:hypothetical protein